MNNILCVFWVSILLYIFFETDALFNWVKLFKIKRLLYEEYESRGLLMSNFKYLDYLLMKKNNFFIQLITCQECLCVWLNVIAFLIFRESLGGWRFLGLNVIMSLIAIATFKKIMKKMYE